MEYIRKLIRDTANGKVVVDNRFKFTFMFRSISVIHIGLSFIFIWLGITPLIIFNIISAILYNLLVVLVKKEKYITSFNFAYAEIFIHTLAADILIGYRFGFQLYMIALIPVSFYVAFTLERFKNRILIPLFYALLSMLTFVACKVYDMTVGSYYSIENMHQEMVVYVFNVVVAYVMVIIFSVLFLLEIYQFQFKLRQANSKLEYLAGVDPLTGLLNRRKFFEQIRERREDITFILLCDIDDFKTVNDSYGHECGDMILVEIARAFEKNFPAPNMVSRWGGEEFCLAGLGNREAVLRRAEQLREDIEKIQIIYEEDNVQVTITIGIAECTGFEDLKEAISRADQKMYEGKQKGKNCVVI